MSALKLSLYRVFAAVLASCKLYLVAQEVHFKISWPFPIDTSRYCPRTYLCKCDASVCMSRYNLVTYPDNSQA